MKRIKTFESFMSTEPGAILYHGVHDHNSAMGQIKQSLDMIIDHINNGEIDQAKTYLEIIKKSVKKAEDSIDYIYSKIKDYATKEAV